ncbi:MAG: hypothetical protein RLZZ606_622 [Actinomycetota bacterium]
MSEVLQVAKALAQSSDSDLVRVVGIRLMPTNTLNDFFDLATALIKPQNVAGAITGLTKRQIVAFSNLLNQDSSDVDGLESLARLFLVLKTSDGTYKPLEAATTAFKQLVTPKFLPELQSSNTSEKTETLAQQQFIDSQAGLSAFETIQALTELVIELEQHYVREVGKGQVGLPELKRLALHLGRDVEYARLLYALAQLSSLVGVSDKRWKVGSQYQSWLTSSPQDRWQLIANTWVYLVGETATSELAKASNLKEAFQETFPLARDGVLSHITRLISLAELIGLTSSNQMSSWCRPLLEENAKEAVSKLVENLPATQNRIIIQADLTIIAVGPLPTDKELELRRFVETERIGVASTYRINTLSVTYGLETGLSEKEIRALLTELSGTSLPQPVDYLIREAATRFGRLVLRETPTGTLIQSSEPILLTQILNDSALKTDIVYYLLRESKYAAIRKDSKDEIISSWRAAGSNETSLVQTSSVLEDIQKWREHDKRLSEAPEGQDLVRQLEMAIKTKATVLVSLQMNGAGREFTIEPTGLANGRLRGRDRKADCERVLPLASITSVRIG